MGAIWVPSMGNGADLDVVTAESGDVLNGKVIVDKDGNPLTGTLQDYSDTAKSATASLDATNSRLQMTVPATGKYSATSKLYAAFSAIASLIGLTAAKLVSGNTILGIEGTATGDATLSSSAQLRKGIIGYGKNGAKYTGSMTEKAAATYTPSTANQTIAASQYLTGTQTIKGDANLLAANIKKGVTIFGIAGTWEGYVRDNYTIIYSGGTNNDGVDFGSDNDRGTYLSFKSRTVSLIKKYNLNKCNGLRFKCNSNNTGYSSYIKLWIKNSITGEWNLVKNQPVDNSVTTATDHYCSLDDFAGAERSLKIGFYYVNITQIQFY